MLNLNQSIDRIDVKEIRLRYPSNLRVVTVRHESEEYTIQVPCFNYKGVLTVTPAILLRKKLQTVPEPIVCDEDRMPGTYDGK